ncbi:MULTISPECIES: hypothetical protein [Olivibacter]|uniref:Adenylate kinase n=1 Tax=Olivibacter jilunii TaxID=985016 RepID=A0ABW6B2L3_9SPHI
MKDQNPITIIYGTNGSGKSALSKALMLPGRNVFSTGGIVRSGLTDLLKRPGVTESDIILIDDLRPKFLEFLVMICKSDELLFIPKNRSVYRIKRPIVIANLDEAIAVIPEEISGLPHARILKLTREK